MALNKPLNVTIIPHSDALIAIKELTRRKPQNSASDYGNNFRIDWPGIQDMECERIFCKWHININNGEKTQFVEKSLFCQAMAHLSALL